MNKQEFWQIITNAKKESSGSYEIQQNLVLGQLLTLSLDDVVQFDHIYNEFMDSAYTWDLWAAAYIIQGGCSDDCFMDFRGWLISRGEEVYKKALINPETLSELNDLSEDTDWEGFGYLASTAYEQLTGEDIPADKSRRHPVEPHGEEWEEEDLPKLLPRLSSIYWS